MFGNSFTVLDPAESDFDFMEQLSPRYITVQKNSETGRHDGWKYTEGDFDSTLTRILDLKGNIEVIYILQVQR